MLALLVVAALAVACDAQVDPIPQPALNEVVQVPPAYDESLPPASAVMGLVPAAATTLQVTDFDQVRLLLGTPELTSAAPRSQRDQFWRQALRRQPLLSPGQLRPDDQRLESSFGFTQDDVSWEAQFTAPSGDGWVLKLRDDLALGGVAEAIAAGVPSLQGSSLDTARRLITVATTDDPDLSWAAEPDRRALVGPLSTSTYVATTCVPFATAFGVDVEDDLAPAPGEVMAGLEPLEDFSVSFGGSLATARLGAPRGDAFDRARVADVLPRTDPDFALGYTDAVADPAGGRIGFQLVDPAVAAMLAVQQRLPFAVCSS